MYRGTNPSALSSRRLIAEAMRQLMDARPYEEISVAAVCRLAGVSRQTFYRGPDGCSGAPRHYPRVFLLLRHVRRLHGSFFC